MVVAAAAEQLLADALLRRLEPEQVVADLVAVAAAEPHLGRAVVVRRARVKVRVRVGVEQQALHLGAHRRLERFQRAVNLLTEWNLIQNLILEFNHVASYLVLDVPWWHNRSKMLRRSFDQQLIVVIR